MEKKPPINFYGVFDQFSRTYEVAKFWIIKLFLDVSDVIHAKEHKKHANRGLYVKFFLLEFFWNFLLMQFSFMMKKDNFKQKLLLYPQVPYKRLLL